MEEIYLELFSTEGDEFFAPIETLVVLFTMQYCDSRLEITFVLTKQPIEVNAYPITVENFSYKVLNADEIPEIADSCQLPNLKLNSMSLVAGLCACLRQIIKLSIAESPEHHCRHLLGFKTSSLLAPSESSPWTRFCEVELISTLRTMEYPATSSGEIPETLARFEVHMCQPVRLHNIYKYTMSKKFSSDGTATQERVLPEHLYAEGSFMTLADVIIFLCITVYLRIVTNPRVLELIPLTAKWHHRMMNDEHLSKCLSFIALEFAPPLNTEYFSEHLPNQSLYKSDVKRYKPRNKIYTKQEDVENSMKIIENTGVDLGMSSESLGAEIEIDWGEIPFEANPDGGSLPSTRSKRKFQQLENLCRPVLKLAKPGDVIVDFCSGSGHLGILIAYLRKNCTVILLENKEESLNRSKLRVKKLKLDNVRFYQCNLDYFKGKFDIGTSLHACGVATDLVIQHCIRRNAVFVCCPCCYGSVQDCLNISYPRSNVFKRVIKLRDYLVIGHAADQTHDEKNLKTKQGYRCMRIIDGDRKTQAEECGYTVLITKLVPESCTPKNNLLVGIPGDEFVNNCLASALQNVRLPSSIV
ncbi:glutathione S-transferase C-terminal domain-containing protein homolog [Diachasma alloeum]|uniref:glutathione S-transferase C-terminal domain-containing protein homolog n=1 Tax=Diachasma alloeum TaxID=454923 RepID=UPI0007384E3E|nr:glutathione S-transferase C-terminal domain-containing protein homolog [Diachasma alloeum]